MVKKRIFVIALLVALLCFLFEVFKINSYISPYIDFMFPKIKTEEQTKKLLNSNKNDIDKMIDNLNSLPYENVEIFARSLLDDGTVFANGNEVDADSIIDKNLFSEYFKDKKIYYAEKCGETIYFSTDTARDYEQGIAYSKSDAPPSPTGNINIYSVDKIQKNYYFYKAH